MLIDGNILFSDNDLSNTTSILPVPLNSSKITSSILLPVSISPVANIVKLPPFSIFLAAPKNFFGLCKEAGSKPPDNVLPDAGTVKLYALANLVILSSNTTTSFFCSTSLLALSRTISATFT